MGTRHLPPGIAIREIRVDDLLALERFYAGLSLDSLDARFHGAVRGIPDPTARSFCGPDHVHREGFVAVMLDASGTEELIGHLCVEPTPDGDVEIAVAVADAWRHQGIGRALLEAGIDWARAHRFERFRAAIRWSNPAIMGLLRSVDRPMTFQSEEDGEIDAVIDISGELPAAA